MTVSEPDPDVLITDSGGRMVRIRDVRTPPGPVDLPLLEEHRKVDLPGPFRDSGDPPYWDPGTVITWHWGRSADVMRVVRDDDELGHLRSWPLDDGWESYRPPAEWDEPLALPDLPSVLEARALG